MNRKPLVPSNRGNEHEKPRKLWTPPSAEKIAAREPLEVAIIIARTLARQAARMDHEQMLQAASEKRHRKRVLTPPAKYHEVHTSRRGPQRDEQ